MLIFILQYKHFLMKNIILVLLFVYCCSSEIIKHQILDMSQLQQDFNKIICSCEDKVICRNNYIRLAGNQKAGYFDVVSNPILNNKFNIDSVDVYTFNNTLSIKVGKKDSIFNVLSVLFIPTSSTSIAGLQVYQHPTTIGKKSMPSSLNSQIRSIAGLYLSKNLAFLASDFPGFAANDVAQTYLVYPDANICASYTVLQDDQFLNVLSKSKNGKRLIVSGYSQGGYLSLLFEKLSSRKFGCIKSLQNYSIAKLGCLQGPYNLFEIVKPYLLTNIGSDSIFQIQTLLQVNLAKPSLLVLSLNSFLVYNGFKSYTLQSALQKNFFNLRCYNKESPLCTLKGMNIIQVLNSTQLTSQIIGQGIGYAAFYKSINGVSRYAFPPDIFFSSMNAAKHLAVQQILNSPEFSKLLEQNSLQDYLPSTDIFFFSLEKDSIVSRLNLDFMKAKTDSNFVIYANQQFKVCNGKIVANVDHLKAELLANIFFLKDIQL